MATDQLLAMHPAGEFNKTVDLAWESVSYLDSIEIKYNLTNDEKALLRQHGFVVTERLRKDSFGWQFLDVWRKDLPVFISSDAFLHVFHKAYDRILMQVEQGVLLNRVTTLLTTMHKKLPDLAARYSTAAEMERMLRDVDIYLSVPLKLLGQEVSLFYPQNQPEINEILGLINAEKFALYPFFSDHCKEIDFSQFKPRGHYTQDPWMDSGLANYFRAMMWLGRIEIYLLPPQSAELFCPKQTPEDIQRQTVDAVLISELIDLADVRSIYDEMEDLLSFFVGEQDNVTLANLGSLTLELNLANARQLLNGAILQEFQNRLMTKAFAFQRIQSQVLKHDPLSTESVRPASAFMLIGQRYVIDSYVTGNVVYDAIKYNDRFICRLFPSTLDVLFALGNDAAAQLLIPQLNEYCYATNLTALRYLVDSYDANFWESSMYNSWLNSIRSLNPPSDRQKLPPFMQTAAWWQQKMNSQLASWIELRHDNILYAKQSYTRWAACSYPCGYVEPVPELYRSLNILAEKAIDKFSTASFSDDNLKTSLVNYFKILHGVTDTLLTISQKELNNMSLDDHEISFIKSIIFHEDDGYAGGKVNGWYVDLLYGEHADYQLNHLTEADYLVADYHTTPSDCAGNEMGWILHAGTGPIDLAIITAKRADGQTVAFAGPVMSYFEYTTTGWERLTDQEWVGVDNCQNEYGDVCEESFKALALASRPDWVNAYLTDIEGRSRGAGAMLVTAVDANWGEDIQIPMSYSLAQNFPNPFNPVTTIEFALPKAGYVTIKVYNLLGEQIATLIEEQRSAGIYKFTWNARGLASGVYLYRLEAGEFVQSKKLILMR